MDRKLISHRIGSILDDISRLSNALYALDTTDIQRYPDNYETLSIDAALRAERIACRLRHLIYSSTTIRKGDYLKSAGATHGITVNCEDRVLEVTLPCLLPKRKQRQSDEFLLDPLYFVLDQYAREHPLPYYRDCVVCFAQVYQRQSGCVWLQRQHENPVLLHESYPSGGGPRRIPDYFRSEK